MKKQLLAFSLVFVCFATIAQTSFVPNIKTYRTDLAFTCITVDSANDIWAGTSGKGLIKISNDVVTPVVLTANNFDKVIIRGLAAEGSKGVWVAHEGYNSNIATYGGVDFLDRVNPANKQHFTSVSLVNSNSNKGLPTRRTESVGIDKNGKVWTSHMYHDLTVPGGNPSYLIYPGGVGVKTQAMTVFDSVGAIDPYPAYTVNTTVNQVAGTRACPTLGIGNAQNEVWVSVASYNAFPFQNSRICRWTLTGVRLNDINETNSLLPLGAANSNPRVMAIHFDTKNRVWVGLNQGKGIGVKLDTSWAYAGRPNIMPAGAVVNQNAIASNSQGEVFIGTTVGLLKYKGSGAFDNDASYIFYTTASGLPSNNITGVTIDKTGAIWLATGAGIVKMRDGDLMVYNLRSMPATPVMTNNDANDAYRVAIASYNAQMTQQFNENNLLYIAADGSNATVFKYAGSNPSHIKFRIRVDPNGQNPAEFGSFTDKYRGAANDSVRVVYHHPSFIYSGFTGSTAFNGRYADLDLVDTTVTPAVTVMSKTIKFILPPVMLVHGIWSTAAKTWDPAMVPFLKSNGIYNYNPKFINAVTYPSDRHFACNTPKIPVFIEDLLNVCRATAFSVGKVDVVCHSLGGIVTRLYLENKSVYKNNIHKLITLNTPHSGSPLANIILGGPEKLRWMLTKTGRNPKNGAVEDLAIGQQVIDVVLNGPQRDSTNGVPVAAIYTAKNFSDLIENANQLISVQEFTKAKSFYSSYPPGEALSTFHNSLSFLKEYLIRKLNVPCTGSTPLNECLSRIYNGPSDWVVSTTSQKGGVVPNAAYFFDGTSHMKVHDEPLVISKVLELLRADAASSSFSTGGFHPAKLRWDPAVGTIVVGRVNNVSSETMSITSPAAGTNYLPGDSVEIKIQASPGIRNALIDVVYSNGYSAFGIYRPDSVFAFRIPVDAGGRMDYKIMAFDSSGDFAADSSFINIQLPVGVVLDSIKIERMDNRIVVEKDDSTDFIVWGYYGGQQRYISNLPGIAYNFEAGGIAAPGNAATIKGLATGFDFLKITYGGKSDSSYIEVVPKVTGPGSGPLPVSLSNFTGKFSGHSVLLNWMTAQELNNKYFAVEISYDGIHFTDIGSVASKGNSSSPSAYSFNDITYFKTGRNYYRLRQTDIDGKFTYSSTVVIIISSSGKLLVTIYPNPAHNHINVILSQNEGKQYTMQLLNITGVTLFSSVLVSGQNRVLLPATISPGLYIIRLTDTNGKEMTIDKLIVQ